MKPIIGITTAFAENCSAPAAYVTSVRSAGGIPFLLPPCPKHDIKRLVALCDAFLFIGGPDLDAAYYGLPNHPEMHLLGKALEDFYLSLAHAVIRLTAKPVLGICLGHQVINVAMGGTLFRHIPDDIQGCLEHRRMTPGVETYHNVNLPKGSPLRRILRCTSLRCNSSHHQAVDSPGIGLKIAACADDGVIEAVCSTDFPNHFIFGIQWHPERIYDQPPHDAIFRAFVSAARRK